MLAKYPPVPYPDFQQISRLILGVLEAEQAEVISSCLLFGLAGEAVLKRHYRRPAVVRIGLAAYHLGVGSIAFADPETGTGFHCWVETEGWLVDFSSIVFPELTVALGLSPCPRLMFQKPLAEAAPTLSELDIEGSFHVLPNQALHQRTAAHFFSEQQAMVDLIQIIADGYQPPTQRFREITLFDQRGHHKTATLSRQRLKGAW